MMASTEAWEAWLGSLESGYSPDKSHDIYPQSKNANKCKYYIK